MDKKTARKIVLAKLNLKTTKKELISQEEKGYLGKKVYKVTLNDGSTRICEQITKNKENGHAVVIIPITTDGKFIMVIESRPNVEEGITISFPAGMIDKGEERKEAAKRELLEETGYISDDLTLLEWHYQDAGCSSAMITTYLATNCRKISDPHLDLEEHLTPMNLSLDEVSELMENNQINSANSKIAYMTNILQRKKD